MNRTLISSNVMAHSTSALFINGFHSLENNKRINFDAEYQLTLACQGITTSAKYIILCIFFPIYSHMYLIFYIIILNFYYSNFYS